MDLSRQKFDKNQAELLLPSFKHIQRKPIFSELSAPSLDSEFGSIAPVSAVVLPTPFLDVDPTFIFFNLTPEVNTSRRSDHDARYKVTWGPLAALNATLNVEGANINQGVTWPKKAGPQALAANSAPLIQGFTLLAGLDSYITSSTSILNQRRLRVEPTLGSMLSSATQAPVTLGLPAKKWIDTGNILTTTFG